MIYLKFISSESFSKSICDECNSKFNATLKFQQDLINNQKFYKHLKKETEDEAKAPEDIVHDPFNIHEIKIDNTESVYVKVEYIAENADAKPNVVL